MKTIKFSANRMKLSVALSVLSNAVASTSITPAHECVYIKVVGSSIIMKTTDTALFVKKELEVSDVEIDGDVTDFAVNFDFLNKLVKRLPQAPIEFFFYEEERLDEKGRVIFDTSRLKITCGPDEYNMAATAGWDYPQPKMATQGSFTIPSNELRFGLGCALSNVCRDPAKPMRLHGVLFVFEDPFETISIAAYNGVGCMSIHETYTKTIEGKELLSIPHKSAKFMFDFLKDTEAPITISYCDRHIIAVLDDVTMASITLTDNEAGGYPFGSIKKAAIDQSFSLDIEEWGESVERASILCSLGIPIIQHSIEKDSDMCFIKSEEKTIDTSSSQHIMIEDATSDVQFLLNGSNLLKLLNGVAGKANCSTRGMAIFIKPEEITGKDLTLIAMQISPQDY